MSVDISVVIPCRNEEHHIGQMLASVLAQEGWNTLFSCEVFVVDGKSTDRTVHAVREVSKQNNAVKLLTNEKQITAAAFNLGIQASRGKYICILGAHSEIAPDYLKRCLETMQMIDADNVGGPWRVRGDGYVGETIALAFQSSFSSGGAKSHNETYKGYLDTVWGGFYKKEVFEKVGLFDEELVRNQDDELNYRLIKVGGKIWQTPEIRYSYICRNSLKRLFFQYLQYGYWKVKVIQKHKLPASVRHVIPACFVLFFVVLACLSSFSVYARNFFLVLVGTYSALNVFFTFLVCSKFSRLKYMPLLPVVFSAYHFAYGMGFLGAMVEHLFFRKRHSHLFTKVSRG